MEKRIVTETVSPVTNGNTEEIFNQLAELNKGSTGGKWIHVDGVGICWKPACQDFMGGTTPTPPSTPPPTVLSQLVEWGKSVDIDNLPLNAVLMIKLNVNDPFRVGVLQRAIAKQVLEPRFEKLKANKTCVLFMEAGDDISVMTEEEMNQAGWEKKEKSRIITLS